MEQNHSPEYQKLPVEAAAPPPEATHLPQEFTILEEYPRSVAQEPPKKHSHAKQILAMCLAGFVAIQLLFSYFVPPTDRKKDEEDGPAVVAPGGSSTGNNGYQTGDFKIKPMPDEHDDAILKRELVNAAAKFSDFDFVRASLYLYNSMMQFQTKINPYDLNQVGYSVLDSVIYDFRAEADFCHIYYERDEIWYENKIGEMESYMALRATMVLMSEESGGDYFQVLRIQISMDQAFGIYGADVNYIAQYIEGKFDNNGKSNRCSMTEFHVSEWDDGNLDEIYYVMGSRRLTGPVANGAFMNGTLLETDIVYHSTGIFLENEYRPGRKIKINALLDDGCLNLRDPSVLDQTTSDNEDALEQYRNDEAIRYLAYTTHVKYKYDNSDDGDTLYNLDITKPLLPLDMHVPFCIRQLISDNQGKEDDGTIPTLSPDLDLTVFEPGFSTASQQLMLADYVGAAITLSNCLRENYQTHGSYQLDHAYLVCVDGQLSPFTGQDLTDGTGVYIRCANEIVQVYNPKVDDYDPENHFIITLIYAVDTGKGGTYTQVLTLNIASYYLGDYDIYHAATHYLSGELEDDLSSSDANRVAFTLSASSDEGSERYRDQYALSSISFVSGDIENACFHGQVLYRGNNHLTLNAEKTAVSWTEENEYYAYSLDLNANGAIDLQNIEYQDDRAYDFDSEECKQTMEDFRSTTNPYLYRLAQDSTGNERLSVKAIENPEGERVDSLLHFLDYDWEHERFPLTYTLKIWKEYSAHIQ